MKKNIDLRVQKTYRSLTQALQELLTEKSLEEITVTELCERAQTRKATFYKHFGDKYELFTFIIRELQEEYDNSVQETANDHDAETYYTGMFLYYLEFLENHEDVFLKILSSPSHETIIALLSEQLKAHLTIHMKEDQKKGRALGPYPELLAAMYTGIIVFAARWWITQEVRIDKEEVVKYFETLVPSKPSEQPDVSLA